MTIKTRKNSPWTISIGSTILGVLLTISLDYLKKEPILTTVLAILKWIGTLIWTILSYNIKVWWLIIAIVIFFIANIINKEFKKDVTSKPNFCNYRKDVFKNWKWSWDWNSSNSENAWVIKNLKAHCPKCDTPMIGNILFHKVEYTCPRCDFTTNYDILSEDPYKIERIIYFYLC